MTKQELLDELKNNPSVVSMGSLVPEDQINGVNKYTVQVQTVDMNTGNLKSRTHIVYVNDEKGENETAYVDNELLKSKTIRIEDYLTSTFVYYTIEDVLKKDCMYKVRAIKDNGDNTFSEKTYIVCDINETVSHGELV